MSMPTNHRQAERKLAPLLQDGILEIDAEGRIWRIGRWKGTARRRAEHSTGSYFQVRATVNGQRVHALAHRLVWHHLLGPIPEGMCTNHKNGIKTDNRPKNLEVVTYSQNTKHAFRTGLKTQWGENNPAAFVPDEHVREIRDRYATGRFTMEKLAQQFGISFQTVSDYVRGRRRPYSGGPISIQDHRHCVVRRDPTSGRFISR